MTHPARPLRAVPAEAAGVDPADAAAEAAAQVARARAALPTLDDTALDCYLGWLTRQMEPTSEADPVAVLASLLCFAGVHLGQRPHVRAGDDPHPLLVWPLIVGRTGNGRKGTSWSTARRVINAADETFTHTNTKSGLSSGEGLAACFALDEDEDNGNAGPRDLRLLVTEPEWAGVMAKMKREGNSLSAILRAAWEGGDLSTLTVSARVAPSSHVGILGHISPGEFRDKVSASDLAGGTYNRFLPLAVAQSKFLPFSQGADPVMVTELGRQLGERLATASDFDALTLSEQAATVWHALYIEFSSDTGDHPKVEQFVSRAVPNCLRIAAIHAALDGQPVIEPAHLRAAAALVRYAIASARAIFTDTVTPARLAAWIAEAGEQGRTKRDITGEFFGGNRKAAEIDPLLNQLIDAGHITRSQRRPPSGKGRSIDIYTAPDPTKQTK